MASGSAPFEDGSEQSAPELGSHDSLALSGHEHLVDEVPEMAAVVGDGGWVLSVDQAKDARKTTLGAYYRVNKKISEYHAAINEVGALYVSPDQCPNDRADS